MSHEQWHYLVNGQQFGPVSQDDLRQLVAAGELTMSDLVWSESMADWQPLGSLPQLQIMAPSDMAPPTFASPMPVAGDLFAGFWKRFAAAILDGILINAVGCVFGFAITFVVVVIATGVSGGEVTQDVKIGLQIVLQGVGIIIAWLYSAFMESSRHQATLGKMALGIKVTDLDGNRISFGRATGRHFGKFISAVILFIGFIMAGITERKQALHDIMAGCLVVNK